MKKVLVVFGVGIILCGPAMSLAVEKERCVFGAVWRSTLLPGWGQFYNGQKTKGWIIIGAESLLVSGAIVTQCISNKAYDKYMEATTQKDIEKYYDRANQYHYASNYSALVSILFWSYNVVDAYLRGRKIVLGIEQRKEGLYFEMDNRRCKIALNKLF